ncbi:MAG: glycosyltransferase family 1 protein [Deltaproteobacteria bacterium]|nr:glycosyltransferase family 1 protein [Deltaproteobacteria bacterium]
MRILYLNAIQENAGWGAEVFVERGFRRNGHDPVSIDFRRHRAHLTKAIRAVGDCDVVFLQRGDHFPVSTIRAIQRPRVFWATELLARRTDQDALLRSDCFAHVFVHSVACKQTLIQRGWQTKDNVSVLLNGFDEDLHVRCIEKPKDIDVLFVGNVTPRRRQLLDRMNASIRVTQTNAYAQQMVDLFNRARIVLNIHAEEALDTETRIFEALGCGAFVLSERLSVESPFIDGHHLVEADSIESLIEKARHFLQANEQRATIAQQGYEEAQAKHTYTHRAQEIAQVLVESARVNASRTPQATHPPQPPQPPQPRQHPRPQPQPQPQPQPHPRQRQRQRPPGESSFNPPLPQASPPMLDEALAHHAARLEPMLAAVARTRHFVDRVRGVIERIYARRRSRAQRGG